jgi:tripartite-type tricarboxylate transporter receptor subunit TctC
MKRLWTFVAALAACLTALPHAAAQAPAWPTKPVKIIVPYQPGQGTDVAARYLAEHPGKALGQTMVVENKPGAGGNIGAAEAARAVSDG